MLAGPTATATSDAGSAGAWQGPLPKPKDKPSGERGVKLSGGQRQRLVICAAFWSKPHMIALDEPTNYLDNDTLAALTQALKGFKGAVVTVSHNEDFVKEISNERWVVAGGSVTVEQLRDAKAR